VVLQVTPASIPTQSHPQLPANRNERFGKNECRFPPGVSVIGIMLFGPGFADGKIHLQEPKIMTCTDFGKADIPIATPMVIPAKIAADPERVLTNWNSSHQGAAVGAMLVQKG